MKKFLLLLTIIPILTFAQRNRQDKDDEVKVEVYKTYGYVNGQRLDSIDAKYGQATITIGMTILAGNAIRRFVFEYGQTWKNEREARITDKEGRVLTFHDTAGALNFFDYNGWDFVLLNLNPYSILLKKKKTK